MKRIFFILVATLFLTATHGRAASLTFDPSAASVSPSDVISLDLIVGDLGTSLVGAFDVDISFDPAVLTLNSFTLGGFLGDIGLGEAIDASLGEGPAGLLNLAEISLLFDFELAALQFPPFPLATMNFTVGPLAAGSSTVVEITTVNALGDELGDAIPVGTLGVATLTNPAAPAAPQFPGPGMMLLLATGLLGFAGSVRRKLGSRNS